MPFNAWTADLIKIAIMPSCFALLAGCQDPIDAAMSSARPTATPAFVPIPGMPDLTKDDGTKNADFKGRQVSVYGLRIGMTEEEVRLACGAHKLVPKKEMRQSTGVSAQLGIYDEANTQLMNVLWRPGATGVDEIILFPAMKERLAGDLQKLFTEEALDSNSALRKDFLGDAPGIPKKEVFLDLEIERHRFAKRDIEVIVIYAENQKTIQFSLRRL
jgi:hypothetical protein